MIINPEMTAAQEIARVLRFPAAVKIDTFAKGKVEILKFIVPEGSPLDNCALGNIGHKVMDDILVCAVERKEEAVIPNGSFVLKAGDKVSIVSSPAPRVSQTAKILYSIYIAITLIEVIVLIAAGMPAFDAVCITFGSAGTGGFGILKDSCASYAPHLQWIITIFVILFGVNFNVYYYLLLSKNKKEAFKIEEVRIYFLIILLSTLAISLNVRSFFANYGEALRHSAFQVGSIITTTGFATTDFNLWPNFSKTILVLLMFIGACAGSTGGGIKVSRIIIFVRTVKAEVRRYIHNRSVKTIRIDGRSPDETMVRSVSIYLVTYAMIYVASLFLLSLTGTDMVTDFTAVAATLNNIGQGLNAVEPAGNYADLSILAKYVLMFDMLAGRLELYPILLLFVPATYRKN